MKKILIISLIALALLAGLVIGRWIGGGADEGRDASGDGGKKILYWVAPMDPNYRREGPGKSPMGMDLIPVYEGEEDETAAGTVRITPAVENNLGVRVGEATLGPVTASVDTVGVVRLDENKLHHQHTRLSGWVQKTWVKAEGDRVQRGQPIVEIYSPELVKAQSELVAAIESGNRTLIEATGERLVSLGIPADQIDRVRRTRRVSNNSTLYADTSGYVDELGVRDGMYITPANPLLSVGPLDTVWVVGELFPKQGAQVAVGDSATIRGEFAPGRTWTGRLTNVLPKLDEQTRTLRVRVAVQNPDKLLRPGMFVRLQLEGREARTLTIPRTALIRTGDMDRVVLAEGDGRFRSVRVVAGREFGERVEILEGLNAGAQVVTSAQFLLDSESSISADLKRIGGTPASSDTGSDNAGAASASDTPWTSAEVLSMPDDNHYARLEHGPVPEWDWPGMVMGFYVAESAARGLRQALESGAPVQVQLRKRDDGKFEVIAMRSVTGEAPQQGENNHDGMQHGDMDHGGMDHSEMNHDDMGHGDMDHDVLDQEAAPAAEPQK